MKLRLVLAGMALLSLALVVVLRVGIDTSQSPGRTLVAAVNIDLPEPAESRVARASGALDVFAEPSATAASLTLPARTSHGSPRALRVIAEQGDWVEVVVPMRPSQARGWVRSDDIQLRTVSTSIVVDIKHRVLTAYDSGEMVFSSPVAVGTADNPTPVGEFFVTDLLAVPDSAGPYGPFAIGLSAYSDTLTEFAGGDGQVGIHGTDDPGSIGSAVSHGCVRLSNEAIEKLFELVSLGTPVVLR